MKVALVRQLAAVREDLALKEKLMVSEGLGEMFESDSADMCTRQFPLMLMGG